MLGSSKGGFQQHLKVALMLYVIAGLVIFIAQWLKGMQAQEAVFFAMMWAGISTAIAMVMRLYYSSKGRRCELCDNDNS